MGDFLFSLGEDESVVLRNTITVAEARSEHHFAQVIESPILGTIIFLDGFPQIAAVDLARFNESVVHGPLSFTRMPKTAFVIGIATGGALAELRKYSSLARVVACDIDKPVVELLKGHCDWSCGAFEDPRFEIAFEDGRGRLEQENCEFDFVLVDVPDPFPGSPSERLFSTDFYTTVHNKLSANGVFVSQAGRFRGSSKKYHARIINSARRIFPHVLVFRVYIQCYYEEWYFFVASRSPLNIATAAQKLKRRLVGSELSKCHFLSYRTLSGLFALDRDYLSYNLSEFGTVDDLESVL